MSDDALVIRIGDAEVRRIEEQQFPVPFGLLTDDEALITRRVETLPAGFLDRETMTFAFSNHSWLIRVDDRSILVDPCNGNGRTRATPNFDHQELPWLDRLHEAGIDREAIDVVFCTHLHNDHCGWNTIDVGGSWVPTFPNAEYLFVRTEYERWDPASGTEHANTFNESVFDECVRPIVDAGLASMITCPYSVSPSISIETAPGHTVGHSMLRLESQDRLALFTGDAFHHPVQLTRPELHLPGCDDLEQAIATRERLREHALETQALLFPAHFAAPHHGVLERAGDEIVFVPGDPRSR